MKGNEEGCIWNERHSGACWTMEELHKLITRTNKYMVLWLLFLGVLSIIIFLSVYFYV